MKTIVPLRVLAIAGNVAFIGYAVMGVSNGIFDNARPILVLRCALLPLNALRLFEVGRAIEAVRSMQDGGPTTDILTPTRQTLESRDGTVLFARVERAENVYVPARGTVRIEDFDRTLAPGELCGEAAARTGTAECETDRKLYRVAGEEVLELFCSRASRSRSRAGWRATPEVGRARRRRPAASGPAPAP